MASFTHLVNRKARVYRNLHQKCYSVQFKVANANEGKAARWIVGRHDHRVVLDNATFKVSEAGRQRVVREKKKNVHAFVTGSFQGYPFFEEDLAHFYGYSLVTYNPYKAGFFFEKTTGREVLGAERVWLLEDGRCWAAGVTYGPRTASV